MCMKAINKEYLEENNYNFIISNVILVQNEEFTYDDIISKIKDIFGDITNKIKSSVKECIIRLREKGYLSELGSFYSVVKKY